MKLNNTITFFHLNFFSSRNFVFFFFSFRLAFQLIQLRINLEFILTLCGYLRIYFFFTRLHTLNTFLFYLFSFFSTLDSVTISLSSRIPVHKLYRFNHGIEKKKYRLLQPTNTLSADAAQYITILFIHITLHGYAYNVRNLIFINNRNRFEFNK